MFCHLSRKHNVSCQCIPQSYFNYTLFCNKCQILNARASGCPSPCVWIPSALITSVGQDRQILPRSGSGEPELQRWEGYPTVGRGPVPRHRSIPNYRGGRDTCEGLSAEKRRVFDPELQKWEGYPTVGRGPSHTTRAGERISLAMRFAVRPHHLYRAESPDPARSGSGGPELQRWTEWLWQI